MEPAHWALLCLSAVGYALSIVASKYLWWLIFLFPIPLFYVAVKEKLTPLHGLVWGFIAMSLHLVGVFIGVDKYAAKDLSLLRFVPILISTFYCTIYIPLWFWLTQKAKQRFSLISPATIIGLWVCSLWLFIFWMDRGLLWICGRWEGYFLFHPLISLGWYPALLTLLPYLGKNILSFLIYLVPGAITLFIIERSKRNALFIIVALTPWLISLTIPITEHRPAWLKKVVPFPAIFNRKIDLTAQAREIQHFFKELTQDNPQASVIIMPESSYYCDHLNRCPELCSLWSKEHLGRPMHLIIGSFRWQNNHYRNCLYWIYDGTIQEYCDKHHAMPLLERLPWILDTKGMQQLFFENCSPITPTTETRPEFTLIKGVPFVPYICSELFFNEHPDDPYSKGTILSISNDSWTADNYISDLMFRAAVVKAIQWQRDILYISFTYAVFIDKQGNLYPLQKPIT